MKAKIREYEKTDARRAHAPEVQYTPLEVQYRPLDQYTTVEQFAAALSHCQASATTSTHAHVGADPG